MCNADTPRPSVGIGRENIYVGRASGALPRVLVSIERLERRR